MSNQTIKAWQESLLHKARSHRRNERRAQLHRGILDWCMVIATVLSAIATGITAHLAFDQAQSARSQVEAAKDQLSEMREQGQEAERNRAFVVLLEAFAALCSDYNQLQIGYAKRNSDSRSSERARYVIPSAGVLQIYANRNLLTQAPEKLQRFQTALQIYQVWLDLPARRQVGDIRNVMHGNFIWTDPGDNADIATKSAWAARRGLESQLCREMPMRLTIAFRNGRFLYQRPPTWLTGNSPEGRVLLEDMGLLPK